MAKTIDEIKKDLINELNDRVNDGIIEKENAALLTKLINNTDSATEAISIAGLGTTYKRTGFHFDMRFEKMGQDIKYLEKDNKLSITDDNSKIVHKLIIGDNYDGLLNLLVEYQESIDVIYIDPPYSKDSMGEFADTNYDNALTRDNLISMLYYRLVLAKQLLSPEGVIYCSIDDRNQAYVKCLFDEVFQEKNFLSCITRKTKSMTGDDGNGLNIQHDYLLVYSKNKGITLNGEQKTLSAYSNPDNDPNGDWTSGDPSARSGGESTYFPITNPYTGQVDYPPRGRYWAFSKSSFEKYVEKGKIKFKKEIKTNQRGFVFKRYANDLESEYDAIGSLSFNDNLYLNSVATDEMDEIFEENIFDYPKPTAFVKKLIQFHPNKNAIVLDFFAGSGTTGQAVLELNKESNEDEQRKFILVQLPEVLNKDSNNQTVQKQIKVLEKVGLPLYLSNITYERLHRVMTGKSFNKELDFQWSKDNKPLGQNLCVYNIKKVANFEHTEGKTPFDVIDEMCYDLPKFQNSKDKVKWICEKFENTQFNLEK